MAKNYEELLKALEEKKAARKAVRAEMNQFLSDNKLKMGNHSNHEDAKIAKGWKKLQEKYDKAKAEVEALEVDVKAAKPKKEREGKYDYPEDCVTADDKKKFRAKMRSKAKAAEKGEKKADKKAEKSDKAEEGKKAEKKADKKADKKAEKKADKKAKLD